jgi:serine O-acetyltransferase
MSDKMNQMNNKTNNKTSHTGINKVLEELCSPDSYSKVYFRGSKSIPMPSVDELHQIITMMRSILFPGYFGGSDWTLENQKYHMGAVLDAVSKKLKDQVLRGYCFFCETQEEGCSKCLEKAHDVVDNFLNAIPKIRHLLATDALAAYEGDPAARSASETIFCYPSIRALVNHRIAHELYRLGVPLIPRIISESAHMETGIDIHPGAQIDERFFMDHGTGIVVGETSIIGKNVRLYQGVTLGAKSFPLDEKGHPIKGVPRHPVVEDNVIIYSGATILGRITLGSGSTIGGNVWLTESVPSDSVVVLGEQCNIEIKAKKK